MAKAKVGSIELTEAQIQAALKANAEGVPSYYGRGDNLINFGSANSFIDEDKTQRRFSMRLANASDEDVTVQFNEVIAAIDGAHVIAEGTIVENVTAAGSPRSVDLLKAFVKHNPIRLRSIKLNVDDVNQLDEPLTYHTESPFETMAEKKLVPSDYQSQNTNNPKMSEVPEVKGWVLSEQSTILYTIRAHKTVNISILFGAAINLAKAVNKKAEEAAQTAAVAFVQSKSK